MATLTEDGLSLHIGIDVGGTTSTVAIGNAAREVLDVSPQFATRVADGPAATIDAIVAAIDVGLARVGAGAQQLADVGLSTPGPATLDGVLLNSPNLDPALWNNFPFRASLEEGIRKSAPGASVHYIGDGQAAALGEYAIRSGSVTWDRVDISELGSTSINSLFMVIVGTGLGGGEVHERRPVRGAEGRAGHAGHIFLPEDAFRYEHDRQLVVGNAKSTLESAVSLTGLGDRVGWRLQLDAWRDHPLNQTAGSVRDKAKQLRELAAAGDALALQLFEDQARALGIGLLAVNYLGDYDLLVIGGGVCDLAPNVREQYRKTAEQAYRQHALDGFRNLERMEFSICGDDAPVIGALAHACSQG